MISLSFLVSSELSCDHVDVLMSLYFVAFLHGINFLQVGVLCKNSWEFGRASNFVMFGLWLTFNLIFVLYCMCFKNLVDSSDTDDDSDNSDKSEASDANDIDDADDSSDALSDKMIGNS